MNVLCKCTPSYDCGPTMRRVWAALCSVDVKTTRNAEDFMSNLFFFWCQNSGLMNMKLYRFIVYRACAIIRHLLFYCLRQAGHKKHFIRFR